MKEDKSKNISHHKEKEEVRFLNQSILNFYPLMMKIMD